MFMKKELLNLYTVNIKYNRDLHSVVFTVDRRIKLRYNERLVSFPFVSPFYLDRISMICRYGGVLETGEDFKKIKIFFVGDKKMKVFGFDFEEDCGWFICRLGELSPALFDMLFDCGNMVIRDGKINGYSLMGLGDPLFDHRGSRKIRNLFLKGFSLLFKGEKCKFVYCSDIGNIGEGNCIGIEVGDKGVVVLG